MSTCPQCGTTNSLTRTGWFVFTCSNCSFKGKPQMTRREFITGGSV